MSRSRRVVGFVLFVLSVCGISDADSISITANSSSVGTSTGTYIVANAPFSSTIQTLDWVTTPDHQYFTDLLTLPVLQLPAGSVIISAMLDLESALTHQVSVNETITTAGCAPGNCYYFPTSTQTFGFTGDQPGYVFQSIAAGNTIYQIGGQHSSDTLDLLQLGLLPALVSGQSITVRGNFDFQLEANGGVYGGYNSYATLNVVGSGIPNSSAILTVNYTPPATPVPEPTSAILLAIGSCGALFRWRICRCHL